MLLLIDAGNTRIKWAVATGTCAVAGGWLASGLAKHADAETLVEAWRQWKITHALISNVAGPEMREKLLYLLQQAHASVSVQWFASNVSAAGIRSGYRNPQQLGCDRFASAIGARSLYPGRALIVATCGTATTIDAIESDGLFLGGMILPGLGLMATSLALNTAQLPQVGEQIEIVTPFADNTHDAIVSGCVAAQTGAIEHAVGALEKRHGAVQCILSGGAAGMIAPHLSIPCDRVDNLVLIGLHAVALESNSSC
ncbi:type III pantothenate kinase [Oxalobacteraceae bacterium R-40]|uniref:Type III pantothenate kinase n=1 Tax=Keguizhuia sedimenti TaxID=3064264 RepID=A0ABU1BJI8_9BURK|nr:type III pantothenate kinase [Oxalobacteraceae bacterium R-40]